MRHEKRSDTRSQGSGTTNQLNSAKGPSDFLAGKKGISISEKVRIICSYN